MNVGILTVHDAHNYGSVLQAYALKKYIGKLGYNVNIINYHHYTIPDGYTKEYNCERWEKFNEYIKELIDFREEVYTKEEELEKLDIDYWICGSDQIWNTEITRGFNRGFFLDFKTKGKKIAYAVSMGIPELPKEYEKDFKRCVEQIDCVSVREEELKEYISKFTNKEIIQTIDPTLLLDRDDYNKMATSNQFGDYILMQELNPDERLVQIAKQIAKEKNVKIVELNDRKKENYFCEQISSASPAEFLSLIKNAKAIVTNSFHGTVFSIIFEKEFYTITNQNRNSRMRNILALANMEDRLLVNSSDIKNVKKQDYTIARKRINEEVKKSEKFLKKALDYC